jgi:hypothetical protein
MKPTVLAWVVVASLLPTSAAWAGPKDDHSKKHGRHEADHDNDADFDRHDGPCFFQPRDIRIVREYYVPQYRGLPPGQAKKLYRTGHLSPGWERKMQPIPVVVEQELIPLPNGYRRGVIDGYVVVYSPRTQVVVDVVALFGSH